MVKKILIATVLFGSLICKAQLNPAITSILQNKTKIGTYYVSGNSTAKSNGILVNCQKVEYSSSNVYFTTAGVPAYPTGPFLDGNPSLASDQKATFKIPLSPLKNLGTPTPTKPGNIGVFINGVALFDYRDGVAWDATKNALCGGPGNPPCPGGMGAAQDWNRDAIPAEKPGFDCSKAHPAMGNYHHHQNPSAFKLDLKIVSTICNLYDADGLYTIDSSKHSPLIGFAYDGFPIYGAYAYSDTAGKGTIVRMKSSYQLRSITARNTSPSGAAVSNGAPINTTYPLGYFKEDYEFVNHTGQADYLDVHNGRFCKTPEYPNGIYCYFSTVDASWNSTYPYVVGPTFYGVYADRKDSIRTEAVTVYNPSSDIYSQNNESLDINIFPNPASEFIAVQVMGLNKENLNIDMYDVTGKLVQQSSISAGATNTYLDTKSLYAGTYIVKIHGANVHMTRNISVAK